MRLDVQNDTRQDFKTLQSQADPRNNSKLGLNSWLFSACDPSTARERSPEPFSSTKDLSPATNRHFFRKSVNPRSIPWAPPLLVQLTASVFLPSQKRDF